MKKMKLFAVVLGLTVFVTSCSGYEAEKKYNIKAWGHKERMLEVEYLREVYKLRSDIELEQTLRRLDSLELNYLKINY